MCSCSSCTTVGLERSATAAPGPSGRCSPHPFGEYDTPDGYHGWTPSSPSFYTKVFTAGCARAALYHKLDMEQLVDSHGAYSCDHTFQIARGVKDVNGDKAGGHKEFTGAVLICCREITNERNNVLQGNHIFCADVLQGIHCAVPMNCREAAGTVLICCRKLTSAVLINCRAFTGDVLMYCREFTGAVPMNCREAAGTVLCYR
jgi:hypothetical protein